MKRCLITTGYLLLFWLCIVLHSEADSRMQSPVSISKDAPSLLESHPSREVVTDSTVLNRLGFRYYENGDYVNAIGCYKKAIAMSPEYPIPLNNLGVVYLKSNQLELAHECFTKAVAIKPEYIKAICNLAVVCYRMGNIDGAKQYYEMAKRIDSAYVDRRIHDYVNRTSQ